MKKEQRKTGKVKGFIVGCVFTMSAVILVGHVLASVSVGGIPEKVTGSSVSLTEFNSIVGTIRGIFNDGGKIGLGVTNPTETLDVAGSIQVNNNTIKGVATPVAGTDAVNKNFVVEALNDGGMPTMHSAPKSAVGVWSWGVSAAYCRDLAEGGYTDWKMPTFDELVYALSGNTAGGSFPNDYMWTSTPSSPTYNVKHWWVISSDGNWITSLYSNDTNVVCVR